MGGRRPQYPKQSSYPQRGSPADVNECRRPLERRVCHHSCHNTVGSFLCTCRPGFRLRADRVSCEGEAPPPLPTVGDWPRPLSACPGHAPSEPVPSPFTPSGHPATPSQRLALPCPDPPTWRQAPLFPSALVFSSSCLLLPTLHFLLRFFFFPTSLSILPSSFHCFPSPSVFSQMIKG